ncbi:MAG: bifunctional glutamate N-acetyltransferase/amino-acid acetyltransferase ArgJ [Armatimonadetes bacterium]|nr:bifunctional glutamate N-acetyltransferase/amino-acid acetyltransferase ArgJ [Armatimonadota bacterium]
MADIPVKIISGHVTSARGFRAAGIHCGIKPQKRDLALVVADAPAPAAGMFTTNRVKSPAVILCQERIRSGRTQAIVVNSGNANTCTGPQGAADARETARLTAQHLGIAEDLVLVASTGVIGIPLPMDAIRRGIPQAVQALGPSGEEVAEAILTTDSGPKTSAAQVEIEGKVVTVGGMTKGAGMIHPNMATTLCFVTTDAAIEPRWLRVALRRAVDRSYNRISVDGDTSTSDTAVVMASGLAGHRTIAEDGEALRPFQAALDAVMEALAKMVVRDGEGATKLVEIRVRGAASDEDAHRAVSSVATSMLVKTAIYGGDPNWGRILMALGKSGAELVLERLRVAIGDVPVFTEGVGGAADLAKVEAVMRRKEVIIDVDLGLGAGQATMWTCDLSEEYVRINSAYMT